jgi:hypothetical protein
VLPSPSPALHLLPPLPANQARLETKKKKQVGFTRQAQSCPLRRRRQEETCVPVSSERRRPVCLCPPRGGDLCAWGGDLCACVLRGRRPVCLCFPEETFVPVSSERRRPVCLCPPRRDLCAGGGNLCACVLQRRPVCLCPPRGVIQGG